MSGGEPRMTSRAHAHADAHLLAELNARDLINLDELVDTSQSRLLLTRHQVGANAEGVDFMA